MRHNRHFRLILAGIGWLASGCGDPLAELEPGAGQALQVLLEPAAALDSAPPVVRLKVQGARSTEFGVSAFELFSGSLSSYYRGKVARGELPETLRERRVPMLSWQDPAGQRFAQPSLVLRSGETYSFVAMGHGLLAELVVAHDVGPVLKRRWPSSSTAGGSRGGLYCSEVPAQLEPASLLLAPDGQAATLTPSELAPERCVVLEAPEAPGLRVPETQALGFWFDPAALVPGPASPESTAVCEVSCVTFGTGCLCALDDRVILHARAPSFFHVLLAGRSSEHELDVGGSAVIVGLTPAQSYTALADVFDGDGRRTRISSDFRTQSASPHVVINEVYADANGAEPGQEWLELVNSGSLPVNLMGYAIEDVGGETVLPEVWLEAGAYAVVLNAGYVPDPELDLLPAPGALVVRVERLGKSGLANAGELLRLTDPAGNVVSRFPASPGPKPGVSVARRAPWSLDDDRAAFALHGAPGASPGAANPVAVE